jgi:TolB protein
MKALITALATLPILILMLLSGPCAAQMRIDVSGVGATQLPISIADFATDSRVAQEVASVIRSDLASSGAFRVIDPQKTVSESAPPDYPGLRSSGAEAFVGGSVTKLSDGRYDVRYRLYDIGKQSTLLGESLITPEADLRLAGHRIADAIYQKLTGERGVFSTRIAFITRQAGRFRLNIADWDGENVQSPLNSPEPIISPSWSPDGTRLAYVSFEAKKPVVYVHDIASGKRRVLANFKGSNSAPAWSPDGKSLAITLSRDGGSQLFLINSKGGDPKRLTQSNGIDTEPVFSSDGSAIYFVSDRGGSPQIYRTPAMGGPVQRVTFTGNYNISPSLSPDGRWLAFISRVGAAYKLHVMDLISDKVVALTDTNADERPTFAPNGKLIMYSTQSQGREALMTTTLDGKIRARLAGQNSNMREPHWGPFLNP